MKAFPLCIFSCRKEIHFICNYVEWIAYYYSRSITVLKVCIVHIRRTDNLKFYGFCPIYQKEVESGIFFDHHSYLQKMVLFVFSETVRKLCKAELEWTAIIASYSYLFTKAWADDLHCVTYFVGFLNDGTSISTTNSSISLEFWPKCSLSGRLSAATWEIYRGCGEELFPRMPPHILVP